MTMFSIRLRVCMPAIAMVAAVTAPLASQAQGVARLSTGTAAAIDVVRTYYRAIDARYYATAWAQWGPGGRPGQTYAAFRRGFAETRMVSVSVTGPVRSEGAVGSTYVTVPVRVDGVTTNGIRQRFTGSYVVRRTNQVDGSTRVQRRWHLYSAKLRAR